MYGTSVYDYTDGGAVAVAALIVGVISFVFAVGYYVLSAVFLGRIFQKAGVEGQWRAWVPIYNFLVFAKLGDLSPWVPLIGFGAAVVLTPIGLGWLGTILIVVSTAMAAWRVGLKLQKEPVWVVLYLFLSIVWLGINAFDRSRWNPNIPPASWASNGFFADRTVWQGVPVQPTAGYASPAPGYQPPADYQPPVPPAGYQPPVPPAGYQPPTGSAGYQPPTTPPVFQPPAAPPTAPLAYQPPASSPSVTPPAGPPSQDPPAAPEDTRPGV